MQCNRCKHHKSEDAFKLHNRKGQMVRKKCCEDCCAAMRMYDAKDGRLEARRRNSHSPGRIQKRKEYAKSEYGKLVQHNANCQEHRLKKQRDKRRNDAAFRLRCALTHKLGQMLHGVYESKAILAFSEFNSQEDVSTWFEARIDGTIMTMENYGEVWHIDHKIACCWYSGDVVDVSRCWRKANLQPMLGPENKSKGALLPADDELQTMKDHWPLSWRGVLPTTEDRIRMYQSIHPRSKVFTRLVA